MVDNENRCQIPTIMCSGNASTLSTETSSQEAALAEKVPLSAHEVAHWELEPILVAQLESQQLYVVSMDCPLRSAGSHTSPRGK